MKKHASEGPSQESLPQVAARAELVAQGRCVLVTLFADGGQ